MYTVIYIYINQQPDTYPENSELLAGGDTEKIPRQ